MPAEIKTIEQREEGIFDSLFGGSPPEEQEAVVPEVEEKAVVEEEVVPEEDIDEESGEIDYEEVIDKKPEPEPDLEKATETVARKMAKENGQKVKQLDAQLKERDLELTNERAAHEQLRARLEELETTQVKPHEHPDYLSLRDEVMNDARAVARRLPGQAKVLLTHGSNFGALMGDYMATLDADGDDLLAADVALEASIVKTLNLSEVPFEELDADERAVFKPVVDKVIDVLERNAPKTKKLQELVNTLGEKAKSGHLVVSTRAYEENVAAFQPVLDAVGDLPDDVIDANPHAIESIVARMVKDSPESAARLKAAKRDVLELIVGPRALTQGDVDKLRANGTDIKAFTVERNKLHREKQIKLIPMLVQSLVSRAATKQAFAELAALKAAKKGEEDEFDALAKTKRKAAPKAPDKKERLDPLRFLGDEGLD